MTPQETRKQRAFILRVSPSYVDRVADALNANEVMIGWSGAPEILDKSLNWEQFRQIIHDKYFPGAPNYRGSGRDAGNMWRFVREMSIGDYLVVPHGSAFYVAKVAGEATHDPSKVAEDTAFRRPVTWLNNKVPIPRAFARSALQSRMKAYNACVAADDLLHEVEELLALAAKGIRPTFDSDLRAKLVDDTLHEMRHGRLNDYGFERLLENILRGLGATDVRIVPRNLDKGADIVGTFVIARTFPFCLAVQAKHFHPEPPVGRDVVEQLRRGMEAENADLGWVATSGTFSKESSEFVKELYESDGTRIELIDGESLARMIVENGLRPTAES